MPRKPAHEQFDTLQSLRDRAFVLFAQHGYEGVSIGDIAKATQLSKGALYWHFKGKAELYLDCLHRLHHLFGRYIFEPMAAIEDPVLAVLHLFRGLEHLMRDPDIAYGVGGYWLIPDTPETAPMREAQRRFEEESTAAIIAVLRRGVDQRRFDLAGDLDDMARAIIALVEAVVLPLRERSADEVHRILAVLARTLFRAYAPDSDLAELTRQL